MSRQEATANQGENFVSARFKNESTAPDAQVKELFANSNVTSAWFAGAIEIGAIIGIESSQYTDKRGFFRTKTQPYIEIHSTSAQMLDRLHSVYGGMRKPRFWNKGGQVAADIVASTENFTVARQEHVLAMKNWLDAESIEEKVDIAADLKETEWQKKGDTAKYKSLLENPAFTAGVLDSRGYVALRPSKNFHTLYIQVTSKNKALLDALESSFGGKVRITEEAGTQVGNGAVVFQTQTDTHAWDIVGSRAIDLAQFASKFLQTPPPQDWNYQRIVERQEESKQLAKKVTEKARKEFQLLQSGEISQLSTDPVLGKAFHIGQRRVAHFLKQELTPDEQKKRRDNIRRFARRKIDAVMARQITAYVEGEVSAVLGGQSDRISYREELEKKFGINKKAFQRDVIPQLSEAIQLARSAILKSQITHERNLAYWKRQRGEE